MEIKSGKDIAKIKSHLLIIGKPKKGKTAMLGTVANHEKLFIISLEKGLTTLTGGDFDYVECGDYDAFKEALNYFMKNYKEKGYTALGIDSITRAQSYLIAKLLGPAKADGKARKLDFDGYSEMLATMRKLLDVLTKAEDFVTIMIAHEEDKDDSKNTSNWPLLDGTIKYEISGYFDTVLVCENGLDTKGNLSYFARIQGNEKCIAGTRLKHLANVKAIANDYKFLLTN